MLSLSRKALQSSSSRCQRWEAETVLLGSSSNSRALWPAFLKWLSDQPDAEAIADPLDKYIASVIQPAVRLLTGKEMRTELIWPWSQATASCPCSELRCAVGCATTTARRSSPFIPNLALGLLSVRS